MFPSFFILLGSFPDRVRSDDRKRGKVVWVMGCIVNSPPLFLSSLPLPLTLFCLPFSWSLHLFVLLSSFSFFTCSYTVSCLCLVHRFLFLHLSLLSCLLAPRDEEHVKEIGQRESVRHCAVAWTIITCYNISQSRPLFLICSLSGLLPSAFVCLRFLSCAPRKQ